MASFQGPLAQGWGRQPSAQRPPLAESRGGAFPEELGARGMRGPAQSHGPGLEIGHVVSDQRCLGHLDVFRAAGLQFLERFVPLPFLFLTFCHFFRATPVEGPRLGLNRSCCCQLPPQPQQGASGQGPGPAAQLTAMLDPKPTEGGQGSNPHPHGAWLDSFPLCPNRSSLFPLRPVLGIVAADVAGRLFIM